MSESRLPMKAVRWRSKRRAVEWTLQFDYCPFISVMRDYGGWRASRWQPPAITKLLLCGYLFGLTKVRLFAKLCANLDSVVSVPIAKTQSEGGIL